MVFSITTVTLTLAARQFGPRIFRNFMRDTGQAQCVPVNDDPTVTPAPLLGLSSGYVQRSLAAFPKQGSRFPWQVHQSYLRDWRLMKRRGVVDDAMVFANPAPVAPDGERVPA